MRRVYDYLREADREKILEELACDFLSDPLALRGMENQCVWEIREGFKSHMDDFIDRLLSLEPELLPMRYV